MGKFTLSRKIDTSSLQVGDTLEESDFSMFTEDGHFVQFTFTEDEERANKYEVKPGIWAINTETRKLVLTKTSFVQDNLLESFISTVKIEECIESFIKNIPLYSEFGIEVAKRGVLLYGPPGSGKSSAITRICNKYNDGKTAIIIWHTSKFEASDVKDFVQTFTYEGVERLILICEDLGGVEVDQVRMKSDSSLLSLLDNQEKTFKIPVLILATTNFPEVFLGNLTNRSGRFDDKIEVGLPPAEARAELLKFFAKGKVTEEELNLIKSKKCDEFPPAHIREVYIRSRLRDKPIKVIIEEMLAEIALFKSAFQKRGSFGLS